jgi:3-hydroxyisobutyryl-CoA hydrolase
MSRASGPEIPKELPGDDPEDVLFGSQFAARTIELNRPKKLNSLDGSMIRKIVPRLKVHASLLLSTGLSDVLVQEWEKSDLTSVVVIAGAGEKAFCAGGDVASLATYNKEGPEGQKRSSQYFASEYQLDHLIATYTKPYIAYMDGITMGGGVGLSVHAPFRIATERTVFAMPETRIGFFPDVGGGFFLPRLDGYVGRYLALTSEQLKGVNAFYAGIATHYIPSASLGDLTSRLGELTFKDYLSFEERLKAVNMTIEEFNSGLPHDEPILLSGDLRRAIDRCFRFDTVESIFAELDKVEGSAESDPIRKWASKTIQTMHERSPTSLKATLRQLVIGKNWNIKQAFLTEHILASNFMKHPDFVEGVEARLMKPTRTPTWKPATTKEVTDEQVDALFQPDGEQIQLFTEGSYSQYPWAFGLPSEQEIREQAQQERQTRQSVLEHLKSKTQGKIGVAEKVEEVLARNCKVEKGGVLKWHEDT